MSLLTKEELEKLTHLTVKQVSEKLGVATSKVYLAAKAHGISFAKSRPSREELEKLTHLTAKEIAALYQVRPNTVSLWGKAYGLKFTRKTIEDRIKPSREELEKLTHLSQKQIAELYGVTKQSVSLWGKDYGLTFTPTKGQYRKITMPSREEIKDLSLTEVVARYNVSITTAGKWRKQLDLLYKRPRREELEKLSHLRQIEIGQILGISQTLVSYLMRKYGISKRTQP